MINEERKREDEKIKWPKIKINEWNWFKMRRVIEAKYIKISRQVFTW